MEEAVVWNVRRGTLENRRDLMKEDKIKYLAKYKPSMLFL